MAIDQNARPAMRWHIAVFLAPAVLVYTMIMILPLFGTLQMSFFNQGVFSRSRQFPHTVWRPALVGLVLECAW